MIGGLLDAILGKSEARRKPFRADTTAGTAAIQQQAQQGMAGNYALAASQRGGMGSAAAIRGAQQANVNVQQQAMQQQRMLEQEAATNFAQQQAQAEGTNIEIAQKNANNLQKVVGLAGGAAMMLSDERAKVPRRYDSAFNVDDGRRVIAVDPVAQREAAIMQRHADEQGIALTPGDQAQLSQVGTRPLPERAAVVEPTATQRIGAGLMQAYGYGDLLSDERAKKVEAENSMLRQMLSAVTPSAETAPTRGQRRQMLQRPARVNTEYEGQYWQDDAQPMSSDEHREIQSEADLRQAENEIRAHNAEMLRRQALAEIKEQRRVDQLKAGTAQIEARERSIPTEAARELARQQTTLIERRPARVASDYRAKTMSDERGKGMMGMRGMEFPEGVKPVEFEYREEFSGMPGVEPGKQFGVLAQDLEKSREGRTVVDEDPASGMKMVDTPKLTMLLAGKIAELEERLRRQEGGRRG